MCIKILTHLNLIFFFRFFLSEWTLFISYLNGWSVACCFIWNCNYSHYFVEFMDIFELWVMLHMFFPLFMWCTLLAIFYCALLMRNYAINTKLALGWGFLSMQAWEFSGFSLLITMWNGIPRMGWEFVNLLRRI